MPRRKIGTSWAPVLAARKQQRDLFERYVADALDELPEELARQLDNVAVVVEEWPTGEDGLLGLYEGVPHTERGGGYTGALPDKITIYRGPIEQRCKSEEHLAREVRTTVLHEIAHHFGISDERLHELGWD